MDMKMVRSISEKTMAAHAQKQRMKKKEEKINRLLISINVMGSAGAIRFVVKGDYDTAAAIDTALHIYARQGKLPVLGSDAHTFFLYPAHAEFQPMNPREKIGCGGARNFVPSKREKTTKARSESEPINHKGSGWRAWLHKWLSLKISSH